MVRQIARRTAGLGAGNLLTTAISFAMPLALARLATPDDYGRFSFAIALVATCSVFTAPGLATAVTQGAARGQHGSLAVAVRERASRSWVAVLAVAAAAVWSFFKDDQTTGVILFAAAPLIVPAYAVDLAGPFLNGVHQYRRMLVVMIAAVALPAAAVVCLLLSGASIVAVTIGYLAVLGVTNLVSLVVVWRRFVANDLVDPELMAYGRRLSWISSLGAIQFYIDRLVIGVTLGFEEVAIYSIAKIFQQGLKTVWTAVNQQQFPALATRDPLRASTLTRRTLLPIWAAFIGLGILAIVVVPVLIPRLFGDGYAASVTPARLLIAAVVVGIPGAQFEMMFRAVADERRLYQQRVTFMVVHLAAMGAGAAMAGVNGACVGLLAAYALNSALGWYLDYRQ